MRMNVSKIISTEKHFYISCVENVQKDIIIFCYFFFTRDAIKGETVSES